MSIAAEELRLNGRPNESIQIYREKVLPFLEQLEFEYAKAEVMGEIANILQQQGEYDDAFRIRIESQLPVYERMGNVREFTIAMFGIAEIFFGQGRFTEAIKILVEYYYSFMEKIGDQRQLCLGYKLHAEILLYRLEPGDRDLSLKYLANARDISERLRLVESQAITDLISRVSL